MQAGDTGQVERDATAVRRWVPWAIGLAVAVTAAMLVGFSLRGDQDLGTALQQVDWRLIPLAMGLHVMAHIFWAARYSLLAQGFGASLGGLAAWRIVTAGVFGGAVTPGKIGGEAVKMTILMRRGMSAARASRLLLTDRSADLIWFMVLGLVSFLVLPPLFGAEAHSARIFALIGTGFLSLFMLFLVAILAFPDRVGRVVQRVVAWLAKRFGRDGPTLRERTARLLADVRTGIADLLGRRPGLAMAALALTAANWIVEFGALWAILAGFGHDVPYWSVFFVGTVLVLVANIPITPGGSGVAELAALALFTPIIPDLSPLAVVLWRGATYDYDLAVGGAFASFMLPRRDDSLAHPHDNP